MYVCIDSELVQIISTSFTPTETTSGGDAVVVGTKTQLSVACGIDNCLMAKEKSIANALHIIQQTHEQQAYALNVLRLRVTNG